VKMCQHKAHKCSDLGIQGLYMHSTVNCHHKPSQCQTVNVIHTLSQFSYYSKHKGCWHSSTLSLTSLWRQTMRV